MKRKLDKFKGAIDFKNDAPDKISKTLDELKTYLQDYSEDEAAKIVEDFKGSRKTPEDKALSDKFLKSYNQRSSILAHIAKVLTKIQEDLIDEQDTKTKAGKASWISKVKEKLKPKENKQVQDLKKDPLKWLKDALTGSLMGALMSRILKPLKWLLAGLFGVGKFGFKIVSKAIGAILKGALKVGGWIFKPVTDLIKKSYDKTIGPKIKKFHEDYKTKVKNLNDNFKGKLDSLKGNAKDKISNIKGKITSAKDKAYANISKFFSGATNKVKSNSLIQSVASKVSKGVKSVKDAGSKVASKAKSLASGISDQAKKQWDKLGGKVKSIGSKLTNFFKRNSGKGTSKVAGKLAMRFPKALSKFASKFVPGLGLALLAFDVYAAAKKSNSIISFAVNLIDEMSGGLLSMGLTSIISDFDGENLGDYVETLIKGSNLGLSSDELNIMDGLDLNKLENKGADITNILNNFQSLNMDGSKKELSQIESQLTNSPAKAKALAEYKRLTTLAQSGKISQAEASKMFQDFVSKEVGSSSMPALIEDPTTGIVTDTTGNPVPVKNSETNIEAHDALGALQGQTAVMTMRASADIAMQASQKAAKSYSDLTLTNNSQQIVNNRPPLQTVVQG